MVIYKMYDPHGDHTIQLAADDWPQAQKLGVPKRIFLGAKEVPCPIFGTAKIFSVKVVEK